METVRNMRNTLRKAEKLRHKTLVDGVFANDGRSLYEFPLRLKYRALSEEELEGSFRTGIPAGIAPLQMMITVPKKKRRHAVDRVLMRRRIREAYRLNRHALKQAIDSNPHVRTLSVSFIYIHTDNADFSVIERKMRRLLSKLAQQFEQKQHENTP